MSSNRYRTTIEIRKQRTQERGDKAHRTQPGFMAQAEECLSEICSFLAKRYPHCFSIDHVPYGATLPETWGNSIDGALAGAVASITNTITGDFYDFDRLRREEGSSWNPMKYAGCRYCFALRNTFRSDAEHSASAR